MLEFQSQKFEPCTLYYPWGPALSPSIKPLSTPQLPLKSLFFGTSQPRLGFPGGSADKESACSAGDTGSFLWLGRSPGEGMGYPLRYSWVSLVAQLVKNLPAMQETCSISGLGRCPGEGKGYPLKYSGLENSMACIVHGVTKSRT